MYRVVLVDDENAVLEGLKKKVDWGKLGLKIVGTATDGLEALDIIEETKPNILITDIIMPIMDGLKLVEKVNETHKEIKTIILSGYDEFSYAQKAIKLGACEYQLKPISIQGLEKTLQSIISSIEEESREQNVKTNLVEENHNNYELIKRYVFTGLFQGRSENNEKFFNKIYESYAPYKSIAAVLEIKKGRKKRKDMAAEEKELIINSVLNVTNEIIESNNEGFAMRLDEWRVGIVMFYDQSWKEKQIRNSYTWLFCLVTENIYNHLNYSAVIGVGNYQENLKDIRDSYIQAKRAVQYSLLYPEKKMIRYKEIENHRNNELQKVYTKREKELTEYIQQREIRKIYQFIDEWKYLIKNCEKISYETVIYLGYKIVLAGGSILKMYRSSSNQDFCNEIQLLDQIKECESIDHLIGWMKEFYQYVLNSVESDQHCSSITSYIIQYVEKNYMKPIELNQIAENLFITPNYLSTLFKKETGQSFKKFLMECRLKKARELLLDPKYKIYQVSNAVGYENEEYLCRLFKKNYGVTCKEFRDQQNYHLNKM